MLYDYATAKNYYTNKHMWSPYICILAMYIEKETLLHNMF
jgi:hypothetical protein